MYLWWACPTGIVKHEQQPSMCVLFGCTLQLDGDVLKTRQVCLCAAAALYKQHASMCLPFGCALQLHGNLLGLLQVRCCRFVQA